MTTKAQCLALVQMVRNSLVKYGTDTHVQYVRGSNMTVDEYFKESNAIEDDFSDEAIKLPVDTWLGVRSREYLNTRMIEAMHSLMMRGLMEHGRGKMRTMEDTVGGRRCPRAYTVPALLMGW